MRRVPYHLLLAPLLLAGCYTVLRHPRVENPETTPEPERVAVGGDCTLCHSDWDLAMFQYAFHPGWYPVYGPWPQWYAEPWWVDVVGVPHPDTAQTSRRTSQGAGLANDRVPAGSVPAGVWAPPPGSVPSGGVVTVPGAGPQPRAADPPAGSPPSEPGVQARQGASAEASASRSSAPAASPTGPATPARPAQPASEPRAAPPQHDAAPSPSQNESKREETPRAEESQGQGMTNDRRGPKP